MQLTDTQSAQITAAMGQVDPDEGDWPTGEMVEAIVEAALRATKVVVVVIEHKYGTNTTVHATEDAARDHLYGYVQEYWSDMVEQAPADATGLVPAGPPEDKDEAIDLYFDLHTDEFLYREARDIES